jgi:hypothetical protein
MPQVRQTLQVRPMPQVRQTLQEILSSRSILANHSLPVSRQVPASLGRRSRQVRRRIRRFQIGRTFPAPQ